MHGAAPRGRAVGDRDRTNADLRGHLGIEPALDDAHPPPVQGIGVGVVAARQRHGDAVGFAVGAPLLDPEENVATSGVGERRHVGEELLPSVVGLLAVEVGQILLVVDGLLLGVRRRHEAVEIVVDQALQALLLDHVPSVGVPSMA